jgi:replicative DNA helicase
VAKSGKGFSSGDAADEIAQLNTPPHSMEAEQAVLGSVIQSVDAWDKIAEIIIQEDFYNRAHRLIFAAITRLISKSSAADPITLKDELESHNELEDVGGFIYLVNLARNTPSSSNISAYANIVRERAIVRELIGVANDIADASFNPEGRDSKELLDLAETRVFEIAEKRTAANEGPVSVSSALRKTIKRIEELSGQDKDVTGVSTGFTDLDKKTSGMQASDLIIVAARPSMGKCIVSGSLLVDPITGARVTIDHMVANKQGRVTSVDDSFKLKSQTASAFVDDGLKPVFKVTTALGKEIETTLTHPFLTGNGWQPLADIKPGDEIAMPRALPIYGQRSMPKADIQQMAKQALHIFEGSPSLLNDGYHRVKVSLQQAHTFVLKSLNLITASLSKSYSLRANHEAGSLVIAPNTFTFFSTDNFLRDKSAIKPFFSPVCSAKAQQQLLQQSDSHHKNELNGQLPSCAFELNKQELTYLLNSLFAESGYLASSLTPTSAGIKHFNHKRYHHEHYHHKHYEQMRDGDFTIAQDLTDLSHVALGFETKSAELAKQIQHILLRFGIISKLTQQTVAKYNVDIVDPANTERFIAQLDLPNSPQLLSQLQSLIASRAGSKETDLLPSSINQYLLSLKGNASWQDLFDKRGLTCPANIDSLFAEKKARISRTNLCVFASLFDDQYLRHLANSDLYWDSVVSIDYQGYKQVYDLTVPKLHNFIAQDICVHNTTFAMNLVENALMLEEKPVLVFSLEMPAEQIMMRMLASLSRVDQTAIRTARLEDTDWAKIQSSVKMLNDKDNLYIDDSSGLTPMDVRTRARKLAREKGGISMIMIDYLQLMRVPSLTDNRTLEIAEISRSLKALAKELECPVIALSQLNRGLEQRADKRPINSDLRESGAIEQDADLIMFIYRDEVYNENSDLQGIAEIIIGKQRNGPIGTTRLTFQGRFSRFENYAGPDYDSE